MQLLCNLDATSMQLRCKFNDVRCNLDELKCNLDELRYNLDANLMKLDARQINVDARCTPNSLILEKGQREACVLNLGVA